MKTIQYTAILLSYVLIIGCNADTHQTQNQMSKKEQKSGEKANVSVFQDLSDRVNDIDNEDGLHGIFKQLKKPDGTNVYDEVLEEIAKEDAESDGQVSRTIEAIFGEAERQMGDKDIAEMIGDAVQQTNEFSKELEEGLGDIYRQAEENGVAEDLPKLLEGLNDFLETGGENGGLENILELIMENHAKEHPEDMNTPLMKRLEELVNNDELSAEQESLNILDDLIKDLSKKLSPEDLERLKKARGN